jgi:hypothetical protein
MYTFAGIGSRQTPKEIIPIIEELSQQLIQLNFTLRSGGANGADSFWENSYDKFDGNKEIFLPWKNFNNNPSELYEVCPVALKLAEKFHRNWSRLSPAAKKLHGRNCYQVLGKDLKTFSKFIICWTPNAELVGGTAQALRLSQYFNIPVFNLANESHKIKLDNHLNLNYSFNSRHYN